MTGITRIVELAGRAAGEVLAETHAIPNFLPKGVYFVSKRVAAECSHANPANRVIRRFFTPMVTEDGRFAIVHGNLEERWRELQRVVEGRAQQRITTVLTDNRSSVIGKKRLPDGHILLKLHWLFLLQPKEIWQEAVDFIFHRSAGSLFLNRIRGIAPTPSHRPSLNRAIRNFDHLLLERKPKPPLPPEGKYYDLRRMFDSLNCEFFGGKLETEITWMQTMRPMGKKMTLGIYDENLNRISIHPCLDDSFVPPCFIETIVYHEMLHADMVTTHIHFPAPPQQLVLPFFRGELQPTRRRWHTKMFRWQEQRFPDYDTAIQWERANLSALKQKWNQRVALR